MAAGYASKEKSICPVCTDALRPEAVKTKLSWTRREPDGVKREVRVQVTRGGIKWQFKRADEEAWDYDSQATAGEWDALEEILQRRAGRGRALGLVELVRKMREDAGA